MCSLQGRTILCQKFSSPIHERVCPNDFFKDNSVGLRDIILQVVSLLKKNKKVVVDDENAAAATRDSYVRMVERKIASKTIASVKVLPEKGRLQLLWSREYSLAENSHETTSQEILQDRDINKWFPEGSEDQVSYHNNEVCDPCEDESIPVFDHKVPLTVQSQFKFEVPAMCMQWEGLLCGGTDEPRLLPGVVSICRQWSEVNPGGRILVICDNTCSLPGSPGQQEKTKYQTIMQSLVKQFSSSPVYMFCIESPADSGVFTKPPNPGLLAFLQRRHHLNIHSKDSIYLYQSPVHKAMAEAAGMPHLKMSRVVNQPNLVASNHVYSIPNIPHFLKDMDIVPVEISEHKPAEIPGFSQISAFKDNEVSMHLGFGRREYLFAEDVNAIIKFNKTYSEMASLSSATLSKFSKSSSLEEPEDLVDGETSSAKKPCLSRSLSSDRELPHWMVSGSKTRRTSQSKSPKPSTSRSESTESTSGKYKRTEYVMTESELAEIAEDILNQAGREDLIRSIKLQKMRENTVRKHTDQTLIEQKQERTTQAVTESLSGDVDEDEEMMSSMNEQNTQCDITPEDIIVTEPSTCVVMGETVSGRVPSLIDTLLISDNIRKKSPQKSPRKFRDTSTKEMSETGSAHVHKRTDLLRQKIHRKKAYKRSNHIPGSPSKGQSSESAHIVEHSIDSDSVNEGRSESVDKQFTEITNRKQPDLSILDEIFS
ncbi:uncharacterized protein [Argopecten irradians]|uniref:uncharacterized protein isoform X2 n=1 Tax=Argopecten irradians TaxID=31199 RepID=UPI0037125059